MIRGSYIVSRILCAVKIRPGRGCKSPSHPLCKSFWHSCLTQVGSSSEPLGLRWRTKENSVESSASSQFAGMTLLVGVGFAVCRAPLLRTTPCRRLARRRRGGGTSLIGRSSTRTTPTSTSRGWCITRQVATRPAAPTPLLPANVGLGEFGFVRFVQAPALLVC